MERYESAIAAEQSGDQVVLAEALRRLAVLRHHRSDSQKARELCRRSYEVAGKIGNEVLAAEALNTLGGVELSTGALQEARRTFLRALQLGRSSREVRARVEQNLGILANIQGDLHEALTRYERSLEAYRQCGDEHGRAIAYHNMGMVSADRDRLEAADCYFRESRAIAERCGDRFLGALCLVNHAEVHAARQRFENALQNAEESLSLFDQMGAYGAKADAYRVIGMIYRETGRPALAEARLLSAIELAISAGSVLGEAEASHELALLYQPMGRNQEALRLLGVAHKLFRKLDARVDLVHVGGKVAKLEDSYLRIARAWGQSIESSASHTFGRCERIARNAVAMARTLGLGHDGETTILLGAYLHDVGKVRVPHEVFHKPGPLTRDERDLVEMHPVWGIEFLEDVDFPWDVKAIVRSHHERYDGTGYPDRLKGAEIPLSAQVVGILDVYDSLMTTRPHQPALTGDEAIGRIALCRGWWSEQVVEAFLTTVAQNSGGRSSPGTTETPGPAAG
jgi:putative nucleotidyltransferase with HDIG domain